MVVQHNMQAMNANRMLGITSGQQAKSMKSVQKSQQQMDTRLLQQI